MNTAHEFVGVIHRNEVGEFVLGFLDLRGCLASAPTEEESRSRAADALAEYLVQSGLEIHSAAIHVYKNPIRPTTARGSRDAHQSSRKKARSRGTTISKMMSPADVRSVANMRCRTGTFVLTANADTRRGSDRR
jgi:predicted RNase H-like HicB family nuclease